jgi:glutamate-1-semialdehyde 2,1-aminomutase
MATARSTESARLTERAARVIPGGVNSGRRRVDPPLVVQWARGAYITDADGNRLIDYYGGAGAAVLGHGDKTVTERVTAAATDGVLVGAGTTIAEITLAERVVDCLPSIEQVLLCPSGSEATYYAIRLARAVTGRTKLIKMQGCYHGFHDSVLRNVHSAPDRLHARDPHSAGMLAQAIDNTIICRYNDLDSVRSTLDSQGEEIAALIVEPIAHNGPTMLPAPGYLEGLRDLCDRYGVLLVFDEVVTGFRHGLGGYQQIAGVLPDLTTGGKAFASGWPIAFLGGAQHLMQRFTTTPYGDVAWAGTYNGNTGCVAAALATLDRLSDGSVHAHIARLGERVRSGLQSIVSEAGIPATVTGYGSIFTLWFAESPITNYGDVLRNDYELFRRYRRELRKRGVWEKPDIDGARSCISARHTDQDIDLTLTASRESLMAALASVARSQ